MATVKIILKTNRKLSDGSYPVVISLAHLKAATTYIRLRGLSGKLNQWSKSLSRFKPSKGENYKILNSSLEETEKKIDRIVEQLMAAGEFSYAAFKNEFFEDDKINKNVEDAYRAKIESLMQLNKIGTAIFYESSLTSVKGFTGGKKLSFDDISYKWLKNFEHHKRLKGNAGNSIAIHLRGLRAIHYEFCKLNNLIQPSIYIRFNIQRLTTQTRKRSLSKEQLKTLIRLKPATIKHRFRP